MKKNYILTIDAGTSGVKCGIINFKGDVISLSKVEWEYFTPDGLEEIGKEFNAKEFWEKICFAIRDCISKAVIFPDEVIGIACSSQRQGCVFLDKDGNELYAGPNSDVRGIFYGTDIEVALGEDLIYKTTGHFPPWLFLPARILWFKENKKDIYDKICKVLMISDWIAFKLTGNYSGEPTNLSESLLFDINRRSWADEIITKLNIDYTMLPEIKNFSEELGKVTTECSKKTGLLEGTPVYISGADTQCALVGSGAISEGTACAVFGTTATVELVTSKPAFDDEKCLWCGCHILDDKWVLEANCGFCGKIYKWFKDNIFEKLSPNSKIDFYKVADSLIAETEPNFNTPLAFLGPSRFNLRNINPNKPGGFLFKMPVSGTYCNLNYLLRAIFENIAFGIRENIKRLEKVTNEKIEKLIICGGMTKSNIFNQILADVLNIQIIPTLEAEATSIGCAIATAVGSGIYGDVQTAVNSMVSYKMPIVPEVKYREVYDFLYDKWVSYNDNLDNLFT